MHIQRVVTTQAGTNLVVGPRSTGGVVAGNVGTDGNRNLIGANRTDLTSAASMDSGLLKVPAKTDDNSLEGLPALSKIHHCDGTTGSYDVDSNNPLQQDFARITHAFGLNVNPIYLDHTAAGVSIWNRSQIDASFNKTEVIETTKLCAKVNASISLSYSPWGDWWNTYVPRRWNTIRAIDTCVDNVGEEQELRYYRGRLASIRAAIAETNAELGSSVRIGAVLLYSESYFINWRNDTQLRALERKDDLIFNASLLVCDPSLGCTVEQYNRGTVAPIFTLAKPAEGIPADDAWTP